MSGSKEQTLFNGCCIECVRTAAMALILTAGTPNRLLAEVNGAEWFKMVRACETVLMDQSFTALNALEAAPYSFGKPGTKEYAVYAGDRALVVSATVEEEIWTRCLVRETDQTDRSRWKELATEWGNGFQSAFPSSEYAYVQTRYNPHQPFVAAILCTEQTAKLLVQPQLNANFQFQVQVTAAPDHVDPKFCAAIAG